MSHRADTMFCTRCLRMSLGHGRSRTLRPYLSTRSYATPIVNNTATQPGTAHAPPAATSNSAAPSSSKGVTSGGGKGKPAAKIELPKSSVPAGTVLKGLNILKTGRDPIALEDVEYPSWIWSLAMDLDAQKKKGGVETGDEGDLFSKSAKQRKKAAKAARKREALMKGRGPLSIPVHEQTVDLTLGKQRGTLAGNIEAASARAEITKALRAKRRATIKESNFLKSMA